MKKIKIWIMICIAGILIAFAATQPVFAEEKEQTLFTLQKEQDISITITYEYDDVSLEVLSPSGQIITKGTETDTITVLSGQTATIIFISQAEAGTWKLRYDKGSNEKITVSADVQDNNFFITEFNMGAIANDSVPVSFLVTGEENRYFNYSISATTNTEELNGKELVSGRGVIGEQMELTVPLSSLNTYQEYYLVLYVSYGQNNEEIFDYAFSEKPFEYTNAWMPEALANVDITIEHDLKTIILNWKNYVSYWTESVYVTVKKGADTIVSLVYPTTDGYTMSFPFETNDAFTIEILYRNKNDLVSAPLTKMVQTENKTLVLPESGKVSTDSWTIIYRELPETAVNLDINGRNYFTTLQGTGTENVTLPEERNTIVLTYQDLNGYTHCYRRTANISMITPEIELLRQINGVTTSEAFIMISGTTNAELLMVNRTEITVEQGTFHYRYPLTKGENEIVIEAVIGDSTTKLNAFVTKTEKTSLLLTSLLWGLLVSLVGIVLVSLLTWLQSKSKYKEIIPLVCVWVFAGILWAGFIFGKGYVQSASYLAAAYQSLSTAKRILKISELLFWAAAGVSAVAFVATMICILVRIFRQRKERKKNAVTES